MSKSRLWVGTSWKMNKTLSEAIAFADGLAAADAKRDDRIQRFVIPPFTVVREMKERLKETSVKIGAQNMHWEDAGAWTGEISPLMLKDCGLDLVELGHSERREHFGETDRSVGLKTAAAVRHGLVPLICIGETLAEREAGEADAVLKRQVEGAFALLDGAAKQAPILLAYEPVWAIGVNGIPATADYADARHQRIAEVAEAALGVAVPVLYGGSVNPGNCEELIAQPHVDGLFIGRSAWEVDGYLDILERVAGTI
ncbi:triosephosphate isomerase 2 (plasmid) [Sinorhizobium fredii NGR234]|uniref:Triosephosphate isomerase n=1 Tax=Sinorhizobium fredii (strain NBRC 101917 / NGR234) TaxID=394 RepID=Q6W288_SINFN|nr:triose-phosphate isomerase [Sinorhizobium fredii]AAQ87129.1 Triosephosphate isomerase [Sinorhizobium fredii NGR234]ACP23190.1 triosephosphate isomerase 2 [Sinorhizobium fredii NGR234]